MDVMLRLLGTLSTVAALAVLITLIVSGDWWMAVALALWVLACTLVELGLPRH